MSRKKEIKYSGVTTSPEKAAIAASSIVLNESEKAIEKEKKQVATIENIRRKAEEMKAIAEIRKENALAQAERMLLKAADKLTKLEKWESRKNELKTIALGKLMEKKKKYDDMKAMKAEIETARLAKRAAMILAQKNLIENAKANPIDITPQLEKIEKERADRAKIKALKRQGIIRTLTENPRVGLGKGKQLERQIKKSEKIAAMDAAYKARMKRGEELKALHEKTLTEEQKKKREEKNLRSIAIQKMIVEKRIERRILTTNQKIERKLLQIANQNRFVESEKIRLTKKAAVANKYGKSKGMKVQLTKKVGIAAAA